MRPVLVGRIGYRVICPIGFLLQHDRNEEIMTKRRKLKPAKPPTVSIMAICSLILLLSGCVSQTITPNQPKLETIISVPSETHELTAPSTATSIVTLAPTLTPTAQPTLELSELENYIQTLMKADAGCLLPCWWGITPEKTTMLDVNRFLNRLGVTIYSNPYIDELGETIIHSPKIVIGGITSYYNFDFIERNQKLDGIYAGGQELEPSEYYQSFWSNYSPPQIIQTYGNPSEVLLRAPGMTGIGDTGRTGYSMWLIYDQLGVIIRYDGGVADLPIYHICPTFGDSESAINRIDIYIQSPENPLPLYKSDSILYDEYGTDTVKTIQDATGLSLENFSKLLTQTDEPACFDSPHDIWPIR